MNSKRALAGAIFCGWLLAVTAAAQAQGNADAQKEFLLLCDLAVGQINADSRQQPKPMPFYNDSYAVRALCVAYDMTRRPQYLDTCRRWADRMLQFQSAMTPKGAYYMNYNRKPEESEGAWYVADSSSIAMGVLATAVHCPDAADRERYLASVRSFADLVMKNYIGEAGGVMNGLWPRYAGEWWCSSGIFGSLAFLLYDETGDPQYLQVGLGALNWLNHLDLTKTKFDYWRTGSPTVIMYVLEAYSAGMQHLEPGSKLHTEAVGRIRWCIEWMASNQASRIEKCPWDYRSQWGSKLGGLPFHMYVYARCVPEMSPLSTRADDEMRHIAVDLHPETGPALSQLAAFAMMSYAEKLSPGTIYRSSRVRPGQPATRQAP